MCSRIRQQGGKQRAEPCYRRDLGTINQSSVASTPAVGRTGPYCRLVQPLALARKLRTRFELRVGCCQAAGASKAPRLDSFGAQAARQAAHSQASAACRRYAFWKRSVSHRGGVSGPPAAPAPIRRRPYITGGQPYPEPPCPPLVAEGRLWNPEEAAAVNGLASLRAKCAHAAFPWAGGHHAHQSAVCWHLGDMKRLQPGASPLVCRPRQGAVHAPIYLCACFSLGGGSPSADHHPSPHPFHAEALPQPRPAKQP